MLNKKITKDTLIVVSWNILLTLLIEAVLYFVAVYFIDNQINKIGVEFEKENYRNLRPFVYLKALKGSLVFLILHVLQIIALVIHIRRKQPLFYFLIGYGFLITVFYIIKFIK